MSGDLTIFEPSRTAAQPPGQRLDEMRARVHSSTIVSEKFG